MKALFGHLIQDDQIFSATLDLHTSIKNHCFASITLHAKDKVFSLCLVLIDGSLDANAASILLEEKLEVFGISSKTHVIALTSN